MEGKIELYSFGSLLVDVLGQAILILLFSWLAGLLLPKRLFYRGRHHTRRVLTTVLGFAITVRVAFSEYEWTLSQELSSPLPSEEAWVTVLLSAPPATTLVAGALVLGITIFANPPPLEDEDGNGAQV